MEVSPSSKEQIKSGMFISNKKEADASFLLFSKSGFFYVRGLTPKMQLSGSEPI